MNSTYAQKSSTVQKASSPKAASVLDSSAQSESLQRKAYMANNAAQRAEAPRPNNTGMPDNLKAGIESLSGFSMDDVRVHYNSSKPATVQALAYTQGTDIHVAPGQEKCLPHEAWHVAQQMAGRVSPTTSINGMPVNDNAALEHEADVMGEKAVQCKKEMLGSLRNASAMSSMIQCYTHIEEIESDIHRDATFGKARDGDAAANGVPPYNKNLPHIAFETMAGDNRIGELNGLYEEVIGLYQGAASVYMGVNACENFFCKNGGTVWVLGGEDGKKDNSGLSSCAVPGHVQPYHSVKMVPFTWNLIGLGRRTEKYTDDEGAEKLKEGKKPDCLKDEESSETLDGKTINYNKLVFEYTDSSDYFFPFCEARALLMEKAQTSKAPLYRWIDSDVRDDFSINKINLEGVDFFAQNTDLLNAFYKENPMTRENKERLKKELVKKLRNQLAKQLAEQFKKGLVEPLGEQQKEEFRKSLNSRVDELFKEQYDKVRVNELLREEIKETIKQEFYKNYVFSGFYNWRYDRSKGASTIRDIFLSVINEKEAEYRKSFWKCVGRSKIVTKLNDLGYIPEPAAYMGEYAHSAALGNLSKPELHGEKQSKESEKAFEGLPHCFIENFSVSKPEKDYFSTNSRLSNLIENVKRELGKKNLSLITKKAFEGCLSILKEEFEECVVHSRQSALDSWFQNASKKFSLNIPRQDLLDKAWNSFVSELYKNKDNGLT